MDEIQLDKDVVTFETGHSHCAADAERRLTSCYRGQHVRPEHLFSVLFV